MCDFNSGDLIAHILEPFAKHSMPGSRTARCRDFPGPCSGNPPFERNGEGYGRRQGRGHCRRVQKARYGKLPAAPPLQSRYANPRAPFTESDVFKRDGRFGLTSGLVHRLAMDFRSRLSEDDDRLNGSLRRGSWLNRCASSLLCSIASASVGNCNPVLSRIGTPSFISK